ncbi:MAG: type II toxin-antitoxin system RelE/ParE family toxin [Candidatus Neomarinimicrobiota bacterium]
MGIKSFKDKQLEKCWQSGACGKIDANLRSRLLNKLDYLDAAVEIEDLEFPPSNQLHPLKGKLKGYWAISISGAWRLIFQFENGNADNVFYDNYH